MKTSRRQLAEVRRRARRIMRRKGWGYGKAMKTAGWQVARACNERKE